MDLISYFLDKTKLSESEMAQLNAAFKREHYKKGDILIKPNNRSHKLIFVEKGLIRSFYDKDGKDITFLFIDENSFIMSLEAIIDNKPDPYGWEVIQDCEISTVNYFELEKLLDSIPALNTFFRLLLMNWLKFFANKLYSLQFQTAEQRYKIMIETYPYILQRASLGHIASYLGITQQTLSVIRGKK